MPAAPQHVHVRVGSGAATRPGTEPEYGPQRRTDVVDAFQELSTTTDQIDLEQVSKALNALADIADEPPEEFRGAIRGVSDLSANLAALKKAVEKFSANGSTAGHIGIQWSWYMLSPKWRDVLPKAAEYRLRLLTMAPLASVDAFAVPGGLHRRCGCGTGRRR